MAQALISRRSLLGLFGKAAIGLPLLQAMMPMGRVLAAGSDEAQAVAPKRLCVIYVPHGLYMTAFLPSKTGFDFPLSPTLEPLARLKNRFSVVSNLTMDCGAGIMHHGGEMFLTNERIGENDRYTPNRLSMDRLVVKKNEGQTLLPSLELSLSPGTGTGHRNTVAFDHRGIPMMGRHDPRAVFELLFGSADNAQAQRKAFRENRSILDFTSPHVQGLRRRLGSEDQRVLEEYLESIRATEEYIQRLEKRVDRPTRPEDQGLRLDQHEKIADRMRNMFDLMYLAFRADLTRVITFTVFKERADAEMQYPDLGLVGEHHSWTHGLADQPQRRQEYVRNLSLVDRYHCEQLAYFLQRLKDTPEGNGTMLDNTLVLFGSGLSANDDSSIHDPHNLPILVAGGEAMGMRQGQHIHFAQPSNLANLHLTLLQRLGVDIPQWKDSSRGLSELTV